MDWFTNKKNVIFFGVVSFFDVFLRFKLLNLFDMNTAVLESNVVYAEAWKRTVKPEKKKSFEEDGMNSYHDASVYEEVLEPDDDFRRAITKDQLLERISMDIERKYDNRK